MKLEKFIRDIPDFPKPGIIFKDITPLLKDSKAFKNTVKQLANHFKELKPDVIVAVESRGFIFGAAVAEKIGCGFVPVRKPGKLPYKTISEEYALEYGTDKLTMHTDAIQEGQKVAIIDDLLATGGTVAATVKLIQQLKGEIIGIGFVIELDFLKGREKLKDIPIFSLIHY
ncbi:MAG: adenine phosphoribosyltransferase [Candidatus Margulisbacteria bacterium]|nr:adenine phosphoribosyltransferase [Candidatus Margulisiibacteriota bacterium]